MGAYTGSYLLLSLLLEVIVSCSERPIQTAGQLLPSATSRLSKNPLAREGAAKELPHKQEEMEAIDLMAHYGSLALPDGQSGFPMKEARPARPSVSTLPGDKGPPKVCASSALPNHC